MSFCFYPKHEHGCPNVNHCPHLGSASLGTLVQVANENEASRWYLHRRLDAECARSSRLYDENQRLTKELEQVKLELKLERQNKFATSKQKNCERSDVSERVSGLSLVKKKRGAPVGHPGWFRKTPTEYDWDVDVPAPRRCPNEDCRGNVTVHDGLSPSEHLQEDVIDGRYRVVLYRHPAACCDECGAWVQMPGKGELLGSRIGPSLRANVLYLRNVIGISYRKIPQVIHEMFGVNLTPAALIGFEKMLSTRAESVVADIAKKLGSSDGAVHADETYSTLDGKRAYYWVHGNEKFLHFQFETTRSGQISRDVLGPHFAGTLVTDCYSGYEAHIAGAKQKCLAHLARTARDWQKLTQANSPDFVFFQAVRELVKRGCEFHRLRGQGELSMAEQLVEKTWLRQELQRLHACSLRHEKAITLQARIIKHRDEWLVFADNPNVPPTNNLAERALRPLVVLRKITFGHRSREGGERMATLMTVAETARRHGHRPSQIFFALFTHPPHQVLKQLYAVS